MYGSFNAQTGRRALAAGRAFEVLVTDRRSWWLAAGSVALLAVVYLAARYALAMTSVLAETNYDEALTGLIALAILRGGTFGRATAYARLLASVLGLGLFVPTIGVPLALLSVLFEWLWYILLARGLFQLGGRSA